MDYYTREKTKRLIEAAGGDIAVFDGWMRGQTCPVKHGKEAYWKHDVDRFIRYKCDPKNEPVEDFD